ncbi:hypothetical protein TRFO_12439 [Tritrichomonas foetus]|uniref:Uncharacterized protein n=1 Tax=Tritrichomonas foetus TaxID=1144522 RepID=A0A1J4L2I8_9EUKA|nr:hypothetical protein TRFO_12439 [Tritrichomonas foetus]|eukprot:OHT17304.1 hypothetical protein TRFO_12439 [Tritrichomonas foetus]
MLNISSYIKEGAIACLAFAIGLTWATDSIIRKVAFIIIPTVFELLFFIILLYSPDFMTPEYSILQSIIHALFFTFSYSVTIIGDFSPKNDPPEFLKFPCKLYIVLAIVFYIQRLSKKLTINIIPFGPLICSISMAFIYSNTQNIGMSVAIGAVLQILINAIIFPPKLVKSELEKVKTD